MSSLKLSFDLFPVDLYSVDPAVKICMSYIEKILHKIMKMSMNLPKLSDSI